MGQENFVSRWSRFFIQKYKVTLLLIVAVIAAGVWGVQNNQRQDFPSISSNIIAVQIQYIGASSNDIEELAVTPIEQAMADLDDLASIRTTVNDNVAFTILEFDDIDNMSASL